MHATPASPAVVHRRPISKAASLVPTDPESRRRARLVMSYRGAHAAASGRQGSLSAPGVPVSMLA